MTIYWPFSQLTQLQTSRLQIHTNTQASLDALKMSQGLHSAIRMTAKSSSSFSRLSWVLAVSLVGLSLIALEPTSTLVDGAALNPVGKVRSANFSSRDRGKFDEAALFRSVCSRPPAKTRLCSSLSLSLCQAATICCSTLKMASKSRRTNHV